MVASVKVKSNTIQLQKSLSELQKKFPRVIKEALANVSALQIRNIRDRTQRKGIDVFGKPFREYSPGYKRAAVKESGVVDLTDTGQMFSSLTSKISRSKGSLFFRNMFANKKAFFHDIAGAGKGKVVRPFFSINRQEEKQIVKVFEEKIAKILLWAKEKI